MQQLKHMRRQTQSACTAAYAPPDTAVAGCFGFISTMTGHAVHVSFFQNAEKLLMELWKKHHLSFYTKVDIRKIQCIPNCDKYLVFLCKSDLGPWIKSLQTTFLPTEMSRGDISKLCGTWHRCLLMWNILVHWKAFGVHGVLSLKPVLCPLLQPKTHLEISKDPWREVLILLKTTESGIQWH